MAQKKKKKVEKVTEVRDGIYIGDGGEARYDLPVYAYHFIFI